MKVNRMGSLRGFIILYFGILSATAVASIWFVGASGGISFAAQILVGGVLATFVVLGFGIIAYLKYGLFGPLHIIEGYLENLLEERYDKTKTERAILSLRGIGKLVDTLSSRYKERLGFSQSVLENLPVPVVIVSTDQKVTFINKECLEMLGTKQSPKAFLGRQVSQVLYKDDRQPKIASCMETDSSAMNLEALFKTEEGDDVFVLANLFPLHDVEGAVTGGFCLFLNTTDLKHQEAENERRTKSVMKAANQISDVSEELSAASRQLQNLVRAAQQGSQLQASRAGETVTAMDEMNASVLEVSQIAQDAAINADDAKLRASKGAESVTEVVSAINEVAKHAHDLKHSMQELDKRSEAIDRVLTVIEDIADQTNLLALNAAIESAHAGDAGRGFAIVADEVRKLAEKTMQATTEVHNAIYSIQDSARKNVEATQIAVRSVERSTEMAGHSGEALAALVAMAESTVDRVRSIATAVEEQSAASDAINEATHDVTKVCRETDSLMQEAAESIETVSALVEKLQLIIVDME